MSEQETQVEGPATEIVRAKLVFAAAQRVMEAIQGLTVDEQHRVLTSTAALCGVGVSVQTASPARGASRGVAIEGAPSAEKPLSIVEFMRDAGAVTNPQKIAAFAYYRDKYESKQQFSRSDLEGYFAKAKEAKPGNFDRDFGKAVEFGWIHQDGPRSYLTRTGTEVVDSKFAGKPRVRPAAAGRRRSENPESGEE